MKLPAYPEYTSTPDPWVGSAPSHWRFLRADFTTTSNKEQISDAAMKGIHVLHYSIPNVQEFGTAQVEDGNEIDSAKLLITTAQLLISKLNPRKSTVCIAQPDEKLLTVCSGEFVPIVPEGDVTLRYCLYTWISDKVTKLLSSRVQSVTRSHQRVSPEDITKLPWAWPPNAEQKQIAAFLDWKTGEIDALITRKRELLEKLAEKRIAVVTQAITRGLNLEVPMRDSGIPWLGKVPKHWEVMKLHHIVRMRSGSAITSVEMDDDGEYPVFGGNGVRGRFSEFNHEGNYVLIGRQGAECGNINYAHGRFWASEHAIVATPDRALEYRWLGETLRAMNLNQYSQAAAQPGLSVEVIGRLAIPFPPIVEQLAIAHFLAAEDAKFDRMVERVSEAINRLAEYRAALIAAATTGQIDVRTINVPAFAS